MALQVYVARPNVQKVFMVNTVITNVNAIIMVHAIQILENAFVLEVGKDQTVLNHVKRAFMVYGVQKNVLLIQMVSSTYIPINSF